MKEKCHNALLLKYLGINTYNEKVVYLSIDADICRSEGFDVHARVTVTVKQKQVIATLNFIENNLLSSNEAALSNAAWESLGAQEGDQVFISHMLPLPSLNSVRSKIYGHSLDKGQIQEIIADITAGLYSDIEITAFLSSCAGGRLNPDEIVYLTEAMIQTGNRLTWDADQVVDKHCVGGLPGNRTSLIVVPIVASYGLIMPKTSSRAITSPAGTADTMEVLAPVNLDLEMIQRVVGKENGCIVWGNAVSLSPADDILIAVERVLDIDSEGQLIASVLSKKIAAGSTHIVVDIPVGPTAKVRTLEMANLLKTSFLYVADALGISVKINVAEGQQPIGRGIGPSLKARDILKVLRGDSDAPQDLQTRSLDLAGQVLEFSDTVAKGEGRHIATKILESGAAWNKFHAICEAQGGFREPKTAQFTHVIVAEKEGQVKRIDNRLLARVAKLAGAPRDQTAGVDLHTPVGVPVSRGQPLFTIHADSKGQLSYALDYLALNKDIIDIERE